MRRARFYGKQRSNSYYRWSNRFLGEKRRRHSLTPATPRPLLWPRPSRRWRSPAHTSAYSSPQPRTRRPWKAWWRSWHRRMASGERTICWDNAGWRDGRRRRALRSGRGRRGSKCREARARPLASQRRPSCPAPTQVAVSGQRTESGRGRANVQRFALHLRRVVVKSIVQ